MLSESIVFAKGDTGAKISLDKIPWLIMRIA